MNPKEKGKVEELRTFIKNKNAFHFDQIQKILDQKEKGNIDLNLDVLYKIHNNGHNECVEILRKFGELFPQDKKLDAIDCEDCKETRKWH